jgi:hypothetical protein
VSQQVKLQDKLLHRKKAEIFLYSETIKKVNAIIATTTTSTKSLTGRADPSLAEEDPNGSHPNEVFHSLVPLK